MWLRVVLAIEDSSHARQHVVARIVTIRLVRGPVHRQADEDSYIIHKGSNFVGKQVLTSSGREITAMTSVLENFLNVSLGRVPIASWTPHTNISHRFNFVRWEITTSSSTSFSGKRFRIWSTWQLNNPPSTRLSILNDTGPELTQPAIQTFWPVRHTKTRSPTVNWQSHRDSLSASFIYPAPSPLNKDVTRIRTTVGLSTCLVIVLQCPLWKCKQFFPPDHSRRDDKESL